MVAHPRRNAEQITREWTSNRRRACAG